MAGRLVSEVTKRGVRRLRYEAKFPRQPWVTIASTELSAGESLNDGLARIAPLVNSKVGKLKGSYPAVPVEGGDSGSA